jgi:transmembrane sensor
MDSLAREIEAARQELAPQWNEQRSARLYAGTLQLKRRRTVRRTAAASFGAIAAAALIAVAFQRTDDSQAPVASNEHTLRLADGSFAKLVGSRSELEVAQNTPARVGLRLLSGRAHFEVVPNTARSFSVEADPYRVEVIGTVFDVERDEHQVEVKVTRGKVRVYGPMGAQDVAAGQTQHFDLHATAARPAVVQPQVVQPPAAAVPDPNLEEESAMLREEHGVRARRVAKRGGSALPSWRSLSQSGDYEAAYASLSRGEHVEDEPQTLMDAADAARLSDHPQSAVQYLERVVQGHGRSPVAPLAAFTLGRVYLDKLGQPDRAAQAFERARALAPTGSLAQDALAREVEALSKGGNANKAYLRAQEYLERYPNGRRLRAVQLYGGIE